LEAWLSISLKPLKSGFFILMGISGQAGEATGQSERTRPQGLRSAGRLELVIDRFKDAAFWEKMSIESVFFFYYKSFSPGLRSKIPHHSPRKSPR
jgi:hypothetical protein